MSEFRKANTDDLYFLTLSVVGWIDVFTRDEYCDILIKNLKYCIENKDLELYAYVIMSNHMHMIAGHPHGKLNEVLRDFKGYTSRQIIKSIKESTVESRRVWMLGLFEKFGANSRQNKRYMFWQKTNHPTVLDSPEILDQKEDYIHLNPVAAGFVTEPEAWYYSSACTMSPLRVMEL
jgi:REP element-mobilizing transposase RayT